MTSKNIQILRKTDVLQKVSISKATLHRKINNGTFPPSIDLGANSVGFLAHEIDLIIVAMATNQDLKATVERIIEKRNTLLSEALIQLAA
ncbi:helix-turn-helix transcriptional regulator [Vibrio atlanticus]|jgi:prophage regulatory protein|uniref:Prophage CP4-57 regulatory protein (AlpA) n=1 Tax=Vibrio atlanticus TaxID=693153 RepID=A0A1C3IL84_9VIBR|nr:AlpA family phage regulatory protein [Vibrio atlanticus]SBS62171.1 Prophage CP4-57 regulatory protein (AlpA) [Vibrio atlanticus]